MGKIALLFAGQGSQYVGMGKDLYENISLCENIYELGESIRPGTIKQCFDSDEETLKKTVNTQPCLFLTDLACADALKGRGIVPAYVSGFSLGEIAAVAYSGILSYEEAFRLVVHRGEAMDECASKNPGGMVAVLRLDKEKVESICGEFKNAYPVNYNCPGQIVVAGASEDMEGITKRIAEEKGRAIPLAVSGAFHTPFMKEASDKLKDMLGTLSVKAPSIPLISNMTAQEYPSDTEKIIDLISLQASNPVKYEQTLLYLKDKGVDTFIEVGAGKTLSGLVKKTLSDVNIYNVSDLESLDKTVESINA